MEKIIELDLINPDDLLDIYNKKRVSSKLINYLIYNTPKFNKNDNVKIIINNQLQENIDLKDLILNGLKREYKICLNNHNYNNKIQIMYLVIGIILLFISSIIQLPIIKEIILIGGSVFIWALVELEIFNDYKGFIRRKILKKLINGEITIIKK